MKMDVTIKEGDHDKPAIVFIHGLGMDKNIWESPAGSRILGGKFPLSVLLGGEPDLSPAKDLTTLFHLLYDQGYTVIAWSQQRPSAGIEIAVSELRDLIAGHEHCCRSGTILIGHSRGGLIARKYLQHGDRRVKGLITLASPHRGSRMAQWVKYLTPLISLVDPLLSGSGRGTSAYAIKKVFDFLKSDAVRELLPDSGFFESLKDKRIKGIFSLSFGGSNPTLFSIYRNTGGKILSFPDVLETLIPEKLFPDEMKKGKGDGLVSLESSRLPWADDHFEFALNHAAILFDDRVKDRVVDFLNRSK